MPDDEWDAISLNYTSGTTGNPKGVVYHHRGAALMCYANALAGGMGRHPVYLWTLPMFHCNGWCFPWTISAVAGTHVCLRWVRAKAIFEAIAEHRVTHLCGAPVVMAAHRQRGRGGQARRSRRRWHSSPPPRHRRNRCSKAMAEAGFSVTHVYGLTETYGPAVVNEWKSGVGRARCGRRRRRGRRGRACAIPALEDLAVFDPETMRPVPADGETLGEVFFRGNIVMKGYLKNPTATEAALKDGWFHSGDLGVIHPDGYMQLKDRSKDIIISGGENISSIEVEDALYKHPAVAVVAVVAKPDEKWGESPCAFVELKPGASATEEELDRARPEASRALQGARGASSSPKSRKPRRARCRSSGSGKIAKRSSASRLARRERARASGPCADTRHRRRNRAPGQEAFLKPRLQPKPEA